MTGICGQDFRCRFTVKAFIGPVRGTACANAGVHMRHMVSHDEDEVGGVDGVSRPYTRRLFPTRMDRMTTEVVLVVLV